MCLFKRHTDVFYIESLTILGIKFEWSNRHRDISPFRLFITKYSIAFTVWYRPFYVSWVKYYDSWHRCKERAAHHLDEILR